MTNAILTPDAIEACESITDFRALLESSGVVDSAGSEVIGRKWMDRPQDNGALLSAYQRERKIVGRSEGGWATMRRIWAADFPHIPESVAFRIFQKGV